MAVEAQRAREITTDVGLPRRLFTIEEYDRMIAANILTADDRVELADDRVELTEGAIVATAAKGDPHILCRVRCIRLVTRQLTADLWLAVQDPVRLGGRSKPEPDLSVYRVPEDAALVAPTAANTLLVAEVADSSLATDRNSKLPLYGRNSIPEAWLFDVINKRVERHTEPGPGGYRQIAIAQKGESLTSTVLPGLTIVVDEILR